MSVFVDTSALYAVLVSSDSHHESGRTAWEEFRQRRERLITSNYVLVETTALLGNRLGFQAVREFQIQFVPVLRVLWVDEPLHGQAVAALLTAGERRLSLVDCVSFELMRKLAIDTVFAFDAHFVQQGFRSIP